MQKLNPNKTYIPLPNNEGCACNECPYMRLNTIDKMINALDTLEPEIILSDQLINQAKKLKNPLYSSLVSLANGRLRTINLSATSVA